MLLDSVENLIWTPGIRLLGLDVGEKTIGLALSDESLTIASPLQTIRRKKFTGDMQILLDILKKFKIGGMIVGWPVNMDGSLGRRAQSTRQFALNVSKHTDIPIGLWDERLSTMAVERMMVEEADMSRKRREELVDKLAAAYILQGALDYLHRYYAGKEDASFLR